MEYQDAVRLVTAIVVQANKDNQEIVYGRCVVGNYHSPKVCAREFLEELNGHKRIYGRMTASEVGLSVMEIIE